MAEPLVCYVCVWFFFEKNIRPFESEHFYTYDDAQRYAENMLDNEELSGVAYYRIEKRYVVR